MACALATCVCERSLADSMDSAASCGRTVVGANCWTAAERLPGAGQGLASTGDDGNATAPYTDEASVATSTSCTAN